MTASSFCLAGAGAFFLSGLVTGVWKYACIARAADAKAPIYVDTAHRTSLLYAFACALLGQLCAASAWPDRLNLFAAAAVIAFFAITVAGYVAHGALRDTDNQLARPHRLGRATVPAPVMAGFMILLAATEIGGFVVVFAGFLAAMR